MISYISSLTFTKEKDLKTIYTALDEKTALNRKRNVFPSVQTLLETFVFIYFLSTKNGLWKYEIGGRSMMNCQLCPKDV
ncbi:MAG: hypothetical protein Q4G58_02440 [bacterium]|nr:hypothetical protein [bacterium]